MIYGIPSPQTAAKLKKEKSSPLKHVKLWQKNIFDTKKKQRHLLPFFTMVDDQVLLHLRILASFLAHLILHGNTVWCWICFVVKSMQKKVFLHVHHMLHMENQSSWIIFSPHLCEPTEPWKLYNVFPYSWFFVGKWVYLQYIRFLSFRVCHFFHWTMIYGRFQWVTCHLQLLDPQLPPDLLSIHQGIRIITGCTDHNPILSTEVSRCLLLGGQGKTRIFFFWKKLMEKKSQWKNLEVFQVILKSYYFIHPEKFKSSFWRGNSTLPPSY